MTPVANRMMRMMIIATITPMITIIFMFFHQYFLATLVDVLWKESAVARRSSVLSIRSSSFSPLSRTLFMLSFRITLTSLTWSWTWVSLVGGAGCALVSAMFVMFTSTECWTDKLQMIKLTVNVSQYAQAYYHSQTSALSRSRKSSYRLWHGSETGTDNLAQVSCSNCPALPDYTLTRAAATAVHHWLLTCLLSVF